MRPLCLWRVTPRTSSPTLSRSTPGPTASTTPAKSWPKPRGNRNPESIFIFAPANFPVHRVGCCSHDPYANLAPLGFGLLCLLQPQFLRAAIVVILNALHQQSSRSILPRHGHSADVSLE